MLTTMSPDDQIFFQTYFCLFLMTCIVIIETILAIMIYGISKLARGTTPKKSEPKAKQSRWKRWLLKWLLLLGTLAAMVGTALWARQLKGLDLSTMLYYHTFCFPVMYGTALFYLFQPADSPCSFFKIPMRYIYLGYVVLEVMSIQLRDGAATYLPAILSGVYLVLAVVALIQRHYKKEKDTPNGQPQTGQPV